jgi:hypothetical protein
MRRSVTALTALAALAGCGEANVASPGDRETSSVANPYDGPMQLEPDHSDNASVLERSGAAGRALECEGKPFNGGGGDYVDGGLQSVQDSPDEALQNWLEEESWGALPKSPYVVERDDGDRVLLSYDVHDETKIAFIAADGIRDYNDDTGWGIESWSQCDPAELPEEVSADLGYDVWENASGERVPSPRCGHRRAPSTATGRTSPPHLGPTTGMCDVPPRHQGQLADSTTTTYDGAAALPEDATSTGFRRDGRELWLGTGPDAAYLVSIDDPLTSSGGRPPRGPRLHVTPARRPCHGGPHGTPIGAERPRPTRRAGPLTIRGVAAEPECEAQLLVGVRRAARRPAAPDP